MRAAYSNGALNRTVRLFERGAYGIYCKFRAVYHGNIGNLLCECLIKTLFFVKGGVNSNGALKKISNLAGRLFEQGGYSNEALIRAGTVLYLRLGVYI